LKTTLGSEGESKRVSINTPNTKKTTVLSEKGGRGKREKEKR